MTQNAKVLSHERLRTAFLENTEIPIQKCSKLTLSNRKNTTKPGSLFRSFSFASSRRIPVKLRKSFTIVKSDHISSSKPGDTLHFERLPSVLKKSSDSEIARGSNEMRSSLEHLDHSHQKIASSTDDKELITCVSRHDKTTSTYTRELSFFEPDQSQIRKVPLGDFVGQKLVDKLDGQRSLLKEQQLPKGFKNETQIPATNKRTKWNKFKCISKVLTFEIQTEHKHRRGHARKVIRTPVDNVSGSYNVPEGVHDLSGFELTGHILRYENKPPVYKSYSKVSNLTACSEIMANEQIQNESGTVLKPKEYNSTLEGNQPIDDHETVDSDVKPAKDCNEHFGEISSSVANEAEVGENVDEENTHTQYDLDLVNSLKTELTGLEVKK